MDSSEDSLCGPRSLAEAASQTPAIVRICRPLRRGGTARLLVGLSVGCVLAGCATPSTLLINDEGKVMRCAAAGGGWMGAPMAVMAEQHCVDDAKRLGFFEMPPAKLGVTLDFTKSPPVVHDVVPGSMASAAGLQRGDAVVRLDQYPIHGAHEFYGVLGQKKPGDTLAITVIRDGSERTLTATVPTK
jgi:membrane-associated protease RseP (regulator of RpoE activity)